MKSVEIENVTRHYQEICHLISLHTLRNEAEYDHAIQVLNELLDAVGANENHPLAILVTSLGHFIGDYESLHYPMDELMH